MGDWCQHYEHSSDICLRGNEHYHMGNIGKYSEHVGLSFNLRPSIYEDSALHNRDMGLQYFMFLNYCSKIPKHPRTN